MEISMKVPYKQIRNELAEEGGRYVKLIWGRRKEACLMAAGDILEENGYLPNGTTYEVWNGSLWFSVDKGTNADLAHYFHEGMIYGPNFFVKKIDEWRSPAGEQKYPNGKMLRQYPGAPAGVRQWTEAFDDTTGAMYQKLVRRVGDILRK